MERPNELRERLERMTSPTLQNWQKTPEPTAERIDADACVDMGWGRIVFGHTFQSAETLYQALSREAPNQRDIAFYLRDPHVLLSMGPDQLFLDPSHTYRLWGHAYQPSTERFGAFTIRRIVNSADAQAVNRIYNSRQMVTCDPAFMLERRASRLRTYLVAEDLSNNRIIGTVTGIDHVAAFKDPENGSSLWCLAVDPHANAPGVGEALVRHLIEHYFTRGRNYIDLSVMHDNTEAIALYEKIGFKRVPVFCVKRKNQINEPLYVNGKSDSRLNPYARIIIREARRRGVGVEILDETANLFRMRLGGRAVTCRESLTELATAVAMSICDDKRLTHRLLHNAGLNVPRQFAAGDADTNRQILEDLKQVVVKPARGEQGDGVSVDIQTASELEDAVRAARSHCPDVIIEAYIQGEDLRVIVIDFQVVAAAVRRPPQITGNGRHSVAELIEKYNRRRAAATGGESRVPLDDETWRCLKTAGYDDLDAIPDEGREIQLRKTANLHTGGTIHDVTDSLHPTLATAARKAARAINIPVTGLDFVVPDVGGEEYVIIEANERPGLANHEPQPTAERFIDLLFPQTATQPREE